MAAIAGLRGKAIATEVPRPRAARKSDRDRGAQTHFGGRGRRQRHDDKGIVLGLFDHQAVIAEAFNQLGVRSDRVDVQRLRRRPQSRIDLAERQ
jgi:hypothetical protein